jgi:hypothetical protein
MNRFKQNQLWSKMMMPYTWKAWNLNHFYVLRIKNLYRNYWLVPPIIYFNHSIFWIPPTRPPLYSNSSSVVATIYANSSNVALSWGQFFLIPKQIAKIWRLIIWQSCFFLMKFKFKIGRYKNELRHTPIMP